MRQPARRPAQQRSELAEALAACRGAFISIGLMSGMSNILMLTGAIFMLEVYDRVLPSRSVPTLVGLVILAAGLYVAQGLLDLPINMLPRGFDAVAAIKNLGNAQAVLGMLQMVRCNAQTVDELTACVLSHARILQGCRRRRAGRPVRARANR